jgi:hypothetical protein
MIRTDIRDTRTLTLELTESDWRALRDIEPDAVGWLQLQIRNRLVAAPRADTNAAPVEWLSGDEY